MRLKSIEIKGFKSFYHKTKIDFPDGIISVVGPNGSGKSNILDAFRWVLGEQSAKNLRGDKMEDVIFSGTKLHNQMNYCEVEVIFENIDHGLNIDFSEVSIKRKAFRNGESNYYLNGKICRLKEIRELLFDSGIGKEGYSVISQGKIDEIVNATSLQRRKILEEASGISKFRFKKEESQKKLFNTNQNMERLSDIFLEIEKQVEPLKKQSEKANKYLELKKELKVVEITSLIEEYDSIYKNYENNKSDYEKIIYRLDKIEKSLTLSYADIQKLDELNNKSQEFILELDKNKNRLGLEKQQYENTVQRSNEKIKTTKESIETSRGILLSLETKLEETLKSLVDEDQNKDILIKEKLEIENNINLKTQNKNLINKNVETLVAENVELEHKIDQFREEKNKYEVKIQFINQNIELEFQRNIENKNITAKISGGIDELEKNIQEKKEEAIVLKSEIEDLAVRETLKFEEILKLKSKQDISAKGLEDKTLEIKKLEVNYTVNRSMDKDMEGMSKSVKTVMENKALTGIKDVVANIIKTDKKYEKAIETALGAQLQHIITIDSSGAKRAVEFLKHTKSGRATFLPLDTIKGNVINVPGVIIASTVVQSNPEYKNIIESLLGRTILVENINVAIELAKKLNYKYRIVTLEGEIFNQGGSITGGHYYKQSNILGRKRLIEELELEIAKENQVKINLQNKLNQLISQKNHQITEQDKLKQLIDNKKHQLNQKKLEIKDFENRLGYQKSNLEAVKLQIVSSLAQSKEQVIQKSEIEAKILSIKIKIDEILELKSKQIKDRSQEEAQIKEIEETINNLYLKSTEIDQKIKGIEAQKNRITELKENYNYQKKQYKDSIDGLYKEIKEAQDQLNEANLDMRLNDVELDEAIIEFEELEKQLKKSKEKFQLVSSEKKSFEEEKVKLVEERYYLESKLQKVDVISNSIKIRLLEEYELDILESRNYYNPEIDFTKDSIARIKSTISSLGNVNLDSIEDYQVLSERYKVYIEQIEDLRNSIEALEKIITDLEKDMAKEFSNNFSNINLTFGKVFEQLFGGGEGSLVLSNPKDVLNSEIEIKAQPPGKKLKSITVMSGGEKALMAIALLFAILMTKPAPFCILDEIDAALDDSNISRFNVFLDKLSNDIQFVTITHRRGTMETSDYIYGVTMQDKGVSKVVSLKFEEATEFIEM